MAHSLAEMLQHKKQLFEQQMTGMQQKKQLLDSLGRMNELEIKLELFDLLDVQKKGNLDLAEVLCWLGAAGPLVDCLEPSDLVEGEGGQVVEQLDRSRFGKLLDALVSKAGGDLRDWAALMVLGHAPVEQQQREAAAAPPAGPSYLQSVVPEAAQVRAAASDGRMRELYALFDMDGDGKLGFKDVLVGLHKIAPGVPWEEAARTALRVLMSYDMDHDRQLDFSEFTHFVCAFTAAAGVEFSQVADALVLAAARPDPPDEDIDALLEEGRKLRADAGWLDPRMHRIFEFWDKDEDGYLSFKELVLGMRKLEPAKTLADAAQHTAALLSLCGIEVAPGATAEAATAAKGRQPSVIIKESVEAPGADDTVSDGMNVAAQMALPADAEENMEVETVRKLNRREFARFLQQFISESNSSWDAVADYIMAVSATAADDMRCASMPGWWFTKFLVMNEATA